MRLRKTLSWAVSTLVSLLLLLLVTPAVLAAGAGDGIPTVESALQWVAAGLAGPMLALFLERAAWFQKLNHYRKWYMVIGLNICASLLAVVMLSYVPAPAWQVVEPYWSAVALVLVNLLGSQMTHWVDKLSYIPRVEL